MKWTPLVVKRFHNFHSFRNIFTTFHKVVKSVKWAGGPFHNLSQPCEKVVKTVKSEPVSENPGGRKSCENCENFENCERFLLFLGF